jgi:hypothetical protein
MIDNNDATLKTKKTNAVGRQGKIKEENKKNDTSMSSDENDGTNTTTNGDHYWKELYAVLSSFGLVFLSYGILLYLLSYEKSECPSPPSVSTSSS